MNVLSSNVFFTNLLPSLPVHKCFMCMWGLDQIVQMAKCETDGQIWPGVEWVKSSYIFGNPDPGFPIQCTTFMGYGATTTIKGHLLSSRPMLKLFSGENF